MRTAPWVREITKRHGGPDFAALGIHAPEFEHERDRDAVARHARRLDLGFPHLVDPDFTYWRALDNQYWPTVYLVDLTTNDRLPVQMATGRDRGQYICQNWVGIGPLDGRPLKQGQDHRAVVRHARDAGLLGRGHAQALDVVSAGREQACDPRQRTGHHNVVIPGDRHVSPQRNIG